MVVTCIDKREGQANNHEPAILPQVRFVTCPIRTSLGILGEKWTILILRDIGFLKVDRFNRILESITGLTPRVLSMRLKQLEHEGLIERVAERSSLITVRWRLTEKGKDALPIFMLLVAFGSKWYSDVVFEDKKPRKLIEIFRSRKQKSLSVTLCDDISFNLAQHKAHHYPA